MLENYQGVAKAFAENEFKTYRVIQDRLFESDFDKKIKKLEKEIKKGLQE